MGTPGEDLRWLPAQDLAALAGRVAPYVGLGLKWLGRAAVVVGAAMTWDCLSQE